MDAIVARKTWRTLEPVHGLVYFGETQAEVYGKLGLEGASGYFASRSAPLGEVPPEVVIATFFNFYPPFVRKALDGVWDQVSPTELVRARTEVADTLLRDQIPDAIGTAEMKTAAELARQAALDACDHPEGRPLFAANVEIEWPDEAHLVLWHAQTLLREFRGDGHVSALTASGVTGCEALLMHAATGDIPAAVLQATRQWPDDKWAAATEALVTRGLLQPDGTFTPEGRAQRDEVEARTDELALSAYRSLGEDGCQRLRGLVRPWSKAIIEGGRLGALSQQRG
jgi:hypothetical protein